MDNWEMAAAIAFELNTGTWKAKDDGMGEIDFTNEEGKHFRITVEEADKEDKGRKL